MPLQIRRGNTAERLAITPLPGELIYDTQTNKIYVGNLIGTAGGVVAAGDVAGNMTGNLNLNNFDITGTGNISITGSLTLTGATISSTGSAIDLPVGSTVGGALISSGAGAGVIEGSTYKINIAADDSTIMLNATAETITATGGVFGPIFTNLIDSADSSAISVTPAAVFNSDVTVEGDAYFTNTLNVISDVSGETSAIFETVGAHNGSTNVSFAKARGTFASPTAVVNGDQLGNIIMQGYSGGAFQTSASIKSIVDGAVSGSTVPGRILFATMDTAGELATRVSITNSGRLTALYGVEMGVHDDTALGNVNFRSIRSRGTSAAPTVLLNGDTTFGLYGSGYDGSTYSSSASMLFQTDGVISSGVVPGKILFATSDNVGNLTTRVVIDSTGRLGMFGGGDVWINDNTVTGNSNFRSLRSRGTYSTPLTVTTGDNLLNLVGSGHDGTSYNAAASISFQVDTTVSTGVVPGRLVFATADSLGSLTTRMTIDSNGRITSLGGITIPNNAVNTDMVILSNYHATAANANNLAFRRGRGTFSVPSTIQSSDRIYDINWGGYDGSTHITACSIQGLVSSAPVSTGVVPGQLDFVIANNSGALATRVSIDAFKATFNVAPRVPNYANDAAANTAVGTPQAGMMYFDTTLSKGKMYDGTTWQTLF